MSQATNLHPYNEPELMDPEDKTDVTLTLDVSTPIGKILSQARRSVQIGVNIKYQNINYHQIPRENIEKTIDLIVSTLDYYIESNRKYITLCQNLELTPEDDTKVFVIKFFKMYTADDQTKTWNYHLLEYCIENLNKRSNWQNLASLDSFYSKLKLKLIRLKEMTQ